jgi:acetyl/propionyl-CoA carboxylase alpha subunit
MSHPAQGRLLKFEMPSGLGVRVDSHGYSGYMPSPSYDTLLAKLIVTSASNSFTDAVRRLSRAMTEFRIEGVQTNLSLLRAVIESEDFESQNIHTRYWAENLDRFLLRMKQIDEQVTERKKLFTTSAITDDEKIIPQALEELDDKRLIPCRAVTNGVLVEIIVALSDLVLPGDTIAVIESMKMQHLVTAEIAGRVTEIRGKVGDVVSLGSILGVLTPSEVSQNQNETISIVQDPDAIREDLQKVIDRHAYLWDENRPEAVARRRFRHQRTARENVADLCDPGSFNEYGGLALAAQATRRTREDLIVNTPADGLVTGAGEINGALVGKERAVSAVMAYDATVLAGTQGKRNHVKTDRIVEVALRNKHPFVLFAEGGGGRPGDVDVPSISGLHQPSFAAFADLSGEVPVIGIVSGRCFAGNAAFLGCCDVIIADRSRILDLRMYSLLMV